MPGPENKGEMRHVERGPQTGEGTREMTRKPELPKVEMQAPKTETNVQVPTVKMTVPEKQRQAPEGRENRKEKKNEER